MAGNVGTLTAKLVAHTGKFTAGMKRAGKSVKGFSVKTAAAGKVLVKFGALLGGAAVAGFAIAARKQMALVDATAKLSDQLGVTTEDLQKLRHAAELTGAGADSLDAGLSTMAKRLGEAARGSGAAAPALKELGLEAKALVAMSPDQAFREIATALEKIEEPAKRNAIAANLFSKANMKLLNTLALGKAGLAATGEEAERLGMTFSRVDAAKVEEANDAIYKLKTAFGAFFQAATIELAPFLTLFADDMRKGIADTTKQAGGLASKFGVVADVVDAVGDAWGYVKATFLSAVEWFGKGIAAIAEAAAKLPGVGSKFEGVAERMRYKATAAAGDAADAWREAREAFEAKTPSERVAQVADQMARVADEAAKAGDAMTDMATDASKGIEDLEKKWQEQIDVFGKTGRQADIFKMIDPSGDPFGVSKLEELDRILTKLETKEALKKAGEAFAKSMKTPLEQLDEQRELLDDWLNKHAISREIHRRGMEKAQEEFTEATKEKKVATPTFTPAAAMTRGSQAAYSTIVKAMMGTRKPEVDLLKEANKQRERLVDLTRESAWKPDTVVIGP